MSNHWTNPASGYTRAYVLIEFIDLSSAWYEQLSIYYELPVSGMRNYGSIPVSGYSKTYSLVVDLRHLWTPSQINKQMLLQESSHILSHSTPWCTSSLPHFQSASSLPLFGPLGRNNQSQTGQQMTFKLYIVKDNTIMTEQLWEGTPCPLICVRVGGSLPPYASDVLHFGGLTLSLKVPQSPALPTLCVPRFQVEYGFSLYAGFSEACLRPWV